MNIKGLTEPASIKLLAVMEAGAVTGPAKNLLEFCRRTRRLSREFPGLVSIETTIVTFSREGEDGSPAAPFVAAARDAGVEIDVIPERYRFDTRIVTALRAVIARRAPDIVQTHNVKSHFLARLSGLSKERPWVAFHHGYTTTDWKMRAYNGLDRWSLPSASRVVTVSRAFARDLARAGVRGDRIAVVHNSIDCNRAAVSGDETALHLRSKLGIKNNDRVMLVAGRLSREKGHLDLIAALGHLCGLEPGLSVKLLVVGDGPERASIEREAARKGLGERLIFTGRVSDVRPYYAMADLLVLPSHSEGSPNVLLEAMLAELPVVATAVGGVPEIVTHAESALLVEPRDPCAMAASLRSVLMDGVLAGRLARNARERVTRCHSPESRLRSLIDIYRDLYSARLPVTGSSSKARMPVEA